MFTLHDETHICNVLRLMADLLGTDLDKLTRDEAAMLLIVACCHDIGKSYTEEEKEEFIHGSDRIYQYLNSHPGEYVKAYADGGDTPVMTDAMIQNYLRSIHHERCADLLLEKNSWPGVLTGKVDVDDVIKVCQSHGENIAALDDMEETATIDLRFCAILLRLADILDFDTSRAPKAIYQYSGFENVTDAGAIRSKEEWDKHFSSQGFDFEHIADRSYLYTLNYIAKCKSMQVEQTVNCYIDWVEQELNECGKQLKRFKGEWEDFILPGKVKRNIKADGYVSGQYRLTLDQNQILELLVGRDLYSDPAVFVRELIQNAIDAVRTREQLDKNLPSGWKGKINIRTWMDEEGYHWFRIKDNGIGMTEEIIKNHFLKIGNSYYTSDEFGKAKHKCKADADYMPISRFGIGILSCFMGDEKTNQVEVSTKHFAEGETFYPALRLSMHVLNGYYYLTNKDKNHRPGNMKGFTDKEKEPYLKQAGTVVAVRTNLYQSGKYRTFKEIIDHYVVCPPVAIHYDGPEGTFDYQTEEEFMNMIHQIQPSEDLEKRGVYEFELTDDQLKELQEQRPEINFKVRPKLVLKCIALDECTQSPYLSGAMVVAKVVGEHEPIVIQMGNQSVKMNVKLEFGRKKKRVEDSDKISCSRGVSG